jgi:hypothetical protein
MKISQKYEDSDKPIKSPMNSLNNFLYNNDNINCLHKICINTF